MAYVGVDVGSVSCKSVVIDGKGRIIKSSYVRNHGLISSVKQALEGVRTNEEIKGVGVTGSGKEFVNLLIGADVLESEIMSHSVAAIHEFPDVRTIFDIGGEDSKLIQIRNGQIENFMMNSSCGGGTGSMIEAIANRMGVKIEEVGELALQSRNDISLPSKCGIFAQSAVVSKLNKGVDKSDILMGICNGLVGNFLTMLGKGKHLKPPFVFQGATAQNEALVHCFEKELNQKIRVPKHCGLMGALGVALLTKEAKPKKTNFRGFEVCDSSLLTKTIIGDGCSNRCEITFIFDDQNVVGHLGNRCAKCPAVHMKRVVESVLAKHREPSVLAIPRS